MKLAFLSLDFICVNCTINNKYVEVHCFSGLHFYNVAIALLQDCIKIVFELKCLGIYICGMQCKCYIFFCGLFYGTFGSFRLCSVR